MSKPEKLSREEYYKKAREYKEHYDWDHASPDAKKKITEGFNERYEMVPDKLSDVDYDKKRKEYEDKYGYDKMSDEKKEKFDREFDREFKKESGSASESDATDDPEGNKNEPERGERQRGNGFGRKKEIEDEEEVR